MKKAITKFFCLVLCLMLTVSVTLASATEKSEIMPRLTGIDSQAVSLTISEYGRASCWCLILVSTGYTVDVIMDLEQDGTVIKTWTASGSSGGRVELSKPYYVAEGHDYQVVVTTRIKTLEGSYLFSYTLESHIKGY